MKTKLVRIQLGHRALERVISKLLTFADAVLTVSSFFAEWNNSKHIFSAILHLLFRVANPLYIKISENKNNLRTI